MNYRDLESKEVKRIIANARKSENAKKKIDQWLEFWRGNHLLAPFAELFARREVGSYGCREIRSLSWPG
jgi:hypothetical protein